MNFNIFRQIRSGKAITAGLFTVAAAMLPCTLQAQDSSSDWESRLTIYGWLPSLEAHTDFPTGAAPGGGDFSPIGVDAGTLVDNLSFVFMGAFQINKGSWGAFTDFIYLDESAVSTNAHDFTLGDASIPVEVDTKVNYDLTATLWSLSGTYRLQDNRRVTSDILLGARMLDLDQKLGWSLTGDNLNLPGPSGSARASETNWDAIIGLKGNYYLDADQRWTIPFYADIGTGDTDLTWQAMAGLGYDFNWGTVLLTYRYLDYQMSSESNVTDLSLNGPMLGVSFKW